MAASYQIIQNGQSTRNTFLSHGNGHLQEEINFRLNAKATSENSKVIETTPIDDLPRSQRTLLSNGRFSAPDIGKFIIQPIGSLQSLAVPCRHSGTPVSLWFLFYLAPTVPAERLLHRFAIGKVSHRFIPPTSSLERVIFVNRGRTPAQVTSSTSAPPPPVIHKQPKIKHIFASKIEKME